LSKLTFPRHVLAIGTQSKNRLEVAAGLRLMWKGGTGWEADDRQRARGPVFVAGLLF